ncbi:hypothetical protein FK216_13740 [Moraxellaceae bacterium AER2_44_116]|nr:hypothetical protein [Moraxellaceae bacterium]TQC95736.1 hypothetical protein FK216_13740 [Moraxellaceae bacterium AER2_44_116]
MNVKTNPTFAIVSILKFWPWLAVLSLVVLMVWILRLGSETSSETEPVITTSPQPSAITPSTPQQAPIEAVVEAPIADGEVDPVPVVDHLPVAHGEVRNQDRVHAGDDSMFLKDEDGSTETTESNENVVTPTNK